MNVSMKVPRYVLKHGLTSIGPTNQYLEDGKTAFVIYGFTDKPDYDLFRNHDPRLLKPYPLVARFLIDELQNGTCSNQLIVVNAVSPDQDIVYAAEMKRVLDALNDKLEYVEASHKLKFDVSAETYLLMNIREDEQALKAY